MLIILTTVALTSCYTSQIVTFSPEEFVKVYSELEGTQNDLFLKANDWMIKNFVDATSVIQHSDKEDGVLIGKYLLYGSYIPGMYAVDSRIYAIIDIRVKDGRARIHIQPDNYSYTQGMIGEPFTKEKATAAMNALAQSFYDSLHTQKVEF